MEGPDRVEGPGRAYQSDEEPGPAGAERSREVSAGSGAGSGGSRVGPAEHRGRAKGTDGGARERTVDGSDGLLEHGQARARQGAWGEAEACFRRVLAAAPTMVQAHYDLAVVLQAQARLEEAAEAYRQAIVLNPAVPGGGSAVERSLAARSLNNLGNVLSGQSRLDEAIVCYRQALAIDPGHVPSLNNLGNALKSKGRLDEAIACFDRALERDPGLPRLHFNRANTLSARGRFEDAIAGYRRALERDPEYADALANLGRLLHQRQRRLAEALAAYDRALRIRPDFPEAHLNRGNVLRDQGRLSEALVAFARVLELRPDFAEAHLNRGNVLKDQARFAEALAAYQEALRLRPDWPEAYSNYLFTLNYDPAQSDAALAEAHRVWGERHPPLADAFTAYPNSKDPQRPLRIGLVSADFGRHPVGHFLTAVLAAADSGAVQYICYSQRMLEDELTERLRAQAAGWHASIGLSDRKLAELVRADGIDILVDLAGHTAGHRLGCFRFRPAPVQVHWAGYCHSVPLMDHSIWDPIQVRAGEERWFVEDIVRLPDARWCYAPPEYAPAVSEPPARRRGYVTFGSFNNLTKVNPEVLDLWVRVLEAVPGARLLLNWWTLADPNERARLCEACRQRGLDLRRLELRRGASTHGGVLGEYADVDIALDPFPFSGCLTTCEALWMGVPVVTLPRSRPVSRQSHAFLRTIGRTEWAAKDADDYVRIAASLAADPQRLAAMRREQRPRMAASPLCDGPRFARNLEAAYRRIWREWCLRAGDAPPGPKAAAPGV